MKKSLISLICALLCAAMILSLGACAPVTEPTDDDLVLGTPDEDVTPVTPVAPEREENKELVTPNVGVASDSEVKNEPAQTPLVDPVAATAGLKFKLTEDGEGYSVFSYSGTETNVYVPFAYAGKPVVEIGYSAFADSVISSIDLPDTIEKIDMYAFCGSTLLSINIPKKVTEIADLAFMDNAMLETITVDKENSVYTVMNNCLVKGDTVVLGAKGSTIPTDPGVTGIGDGAFRGSGITSIDIPSNITKFGKAVFMGCISLTNVSFYQGMTGIEDAMFTNCTGLGRIEIPSSVTYIGARSFRGCTSITAISIPANVVDIGQYAFEGCTKLSSLTIENGVTTIGGAAFKNCVQLTSVVIPDSVTNIGAAAFWECISLANVSLGETSFSRLSVLGGGAFYNCYALREIFIPGTVYTLGAGLFYGCTYTETDEEGNVISSFVVRCEATGYLKQDEWACGARVVYKQTRA